MKTKFDLIVEDAKQFVMSLSLFSLNEPGLISRMERSYSIKPLQLETEKYVSKIDSEVLTLNNAPYGLEIGLSGTNYFFVEIAVPVTGPFKYLSQILPPGTLDNKVFFIAGNSIIFKEFSQQPLSGNNELIDAINKKAKAKFNTIQQHINSFNSEAAKFNESLLSQIEALISTQKKKLITLEESERKINPFL